MSYGADARQKMDIYLPANRSVTSTKVLFLIHGGGWNEGDKADFTGAVAGLQSLLPDYAIININYRLVANNRNLFPTQENDVKAAAEFVFSKKKNILFPINGFSLAPAQAGTWHYCNLINTAARLNQKQSFPFLGLLI